MKKLLYILLFVPLALIGQENYSLSFDGVDDKILIQSQSNDFNLTNVSIVAKISWGGPNGSEYSSIVDKLPGIDAGYGLQIYNYYSGKVGWEFANGTNYVSCNGGQLVENEWTSIVSTYDGDVLKLYIDGVLVNETLYSFQLISNDSPISIGHRHTSVDEYFKGQIDEVSIFDNALTYDDIQSYMICSPSGNEEGLVGYWNFNEGIGDTVYDISGNGNHGIIYGATYSEDIPEQNCIEGCVDPDAINFDAEATIDDGSCISLEEYIIDSLQAKLDTLNNDATTSISSLQQALDTWNTTIDLSAGWNIIGYGCPSSINVADGLSNHTESIIITKANNGNVYMPEFGFNGIGDFTPGFGYQIKLTEAIDSFSLCDWYVNDIPEDNIVSLQDSIINMHTTNCINDGYCGFDNENQICVSPEQGYDCDGNLAQYQVGDLVLGGIVFYVDETGFHGLIAALDDLTEGATDPYSWGFNGYEWGCKNIDVIDANNSQLGFGYSNTLAIINHPCETENGGITAAQAAYNYVFNGYDDWYLPSRDELLEMYNSIGNGGEFGNIGNFNTGDEGAFDGPYYFSSTQGSLTQVRIVRFATGYTKLNDKDFTYRVRPIRSF